MFVEKSFKSYPVLRDAGRLISTEETILVDVVNLFLSILIHQAMTFLNVPFKIGILSLPTSLRIFLTPLSTTVITLKLEMIPQLEALMTPTLVMN